ncbi:MAG: family 43 glycosylhydrolase, partial [Acidimicrobiales bacterium]
MAGVVAVVLAGSLVAGYSVRRHEAGLHLRPRPATSGSAPWPVSAGRHASARLSASRRVPPRPPPAADPSDPGAALAVGGFDLGEPFVLATGSGYSLFTSQSLPLVDLPVVTAAPKGSWGVEADALSSAPTWAAPGPLTGPDAAPLDGHWILFFAAQDAAPDRAPGTGSAPGAVAGARLPRCIGTAVAASPDGPYTPAPAPLVCPGAGGGDPRLFAGPDGTPYLAWVSGASAAGGAAVWSQQLSAAGTALVGQPAVVYRPDLPWQQGTMASAGMLTGGGRTWLVYSAGGGFTSPTDAVGIAACDGPLGPCADRSAFPLLASNAQGAGPGDPTALVTGGQDWLVYNPGYSVGGATARSVDVARLGFGPQGPYLATSGLPPAGPAGQSTPAVPAAATGAVEP